MQLHGKYAFKIPIKPDHRRSHGLISIFKYLSITPSMCFQLNVTNMLIRHVVRGHNLIGEGATNSLYIYIYILCKPGRNQFRCKLVEYDFGK